MVANYTWLTAHNSKTPEKGGQAVMFNGSFQISSMDQSVLYRLRNLIDHSVISVHKNQFQIGRMTTNDLAIVNNQYISSCHCIINFDNGHVYIRDTSTNGTLINRSKKINKNDSPIELQTGDILHLVFRKDEPRANIIYQLDLPPASKAISQNDSKIKRKHSETPLTSPNDTKENADLSGLANTSIDIETKRLKTTDNSALKIGEDMEDVLTCVCCQDIMTNPISLEPCLHAFCSDCYNSWEAIQRTCPQCRVKVIGKKRNVVINGILEAYLKAYPDKRPALKTIDNTKPTLAKPSTAEHQVGSDGMYLHSQQVDDEDEDEEDEDDEDNEDDDEEEEEEEDNDDEEEMDDDDDDNDRFVLFVAAPVPNVRFGCRQCPTNDLVVKTNTAGTDFQCHAGQKHLLCQCCVQPMPDRQGERNVHQSCEMCHQYFCNVYFQKCDQKNCLGCLNQLKNFNFAPRHLVNLVNDNPIETQIVQNYLNTRRMTMRDLLLECCKRLDRKDFTYTGINQNGTVPSSKVVCYKCGIKIFKELAYQFRLAMKPNEILPAALRHRDNCYYGKQCRTQYTKPGHAQKLNHACEQTRY